MAPEGDFSREAAAKSVDQIRLENQRFYSSELGQGALRDLQQTFPHHWLYVGELLQNAIDAGATAIRLEEISDGLLIEHDGRPFTEKDVRALCSRGISTKGAGTVGFMGIGFKAIFRTYERADICSGAWRFGFRVEETVGDYGERVRDWLGCVIPLESDIEAPSAGMSSRFRLSGRLPHLGTVNSDIERIVSKDLNILAMMALRGVRQFSWNCHTWHLSAVSQLAHDGTTRWLLSAREEPTGLVHSWVLFRAIYKPSKSAVARFLEHRQINPKPEDRERVYEEAARPRCVDVFCPLNDRGTPVPVQAGKAFALLCTGVDVPFGLNVQADWLLNTSRQELMEVEDDPWHEEILQCLPSLIKAYLVWAVSIPGAADDELSRALDVLPAWPQLHGPLGASLSSDRFRESVQQMLRDARIIPVWTKAGPGFAAPSTARLLPEALDKFTDESMQPWTLFGDNIIRTAAMSEQTLDSLRSLGLLRSLQPQELAAHWETGAVGAWREVMKRSGGDALPRLLGALSELDGDLTWAHARLRCLPTTAGGWIDRFQAVGLPANWDSVPREEPPIQEWLDPFLSPAEIRLEWEFDRTVMQDRASGARNYLERLRRTPLAKALQDWWDSLDREPQGGVVDRVLAVTNWVRSKLPNQPNFVARVLCRDAHRIVLVPFEEAVLAAPYAMDERQLFYPDCFPVSDCYLWYDPAASEADWRSFFEAPQLRVHGPLRLIKLDKCLSTKELEAILPGFVAFGSWNWKGGSYEGHYFSNGQCILFDWALPGELRRILSGSVERDVLLALGKYLYEARYELSQTSKQSLVYRLARKHPQKENTGVDCSWVTELKNSRWVYAKDGSGPFTPDQVLPRLDIARPDAPVADLPDGLAEVLQRCGVTFGTAIRDVSAIERLQREGPQASGEKLCDLLVKATEEAAENDAARTELACLLKSMALIPVPDIVKLVDGSRRVTIERLVAKSSQGSDLGGWLLPISELDKQRPSHLSLADRIKEISGIPESPTSFQALAYLEWVWQNEPEAERVRRTLPRAYGLIWEAIETEEMRECWDRARHGAKVYGSNRRWESVKSENVFLDDLGEELLRSREDLIFATPGHLGDTSEQQLRIAEMLGVKLLSTHFRVEVVVEGSKSPSDSWSACLSGIYAFLTELSRFGPASTKFEVPTPIVFVCDGLTKAVYDHDGKQRSCYVYAACKDNDVLLSGRPIDFLADLTTLLFRKTGLADRQDLADLVPTVAQLVASLDSPGEFELRLQNARKKYGLPSETNHEREENRRKEEGGEGNHLGDEGDQQAQKGGRNGQPESSEPNPPQSQRQNDTSSGRKEDPRTSTHRPGPGSGGSYTSEDREGRLNAIREKKKRLEEREQQLLAVAPLPPDNLESERESEEKQEGEFGKDLEFRDAVMQYEKNRGRFPEAAGPSQAGFDIDSFDCPAEDPDRLLVRRIEVKGRGRQWTGGETIELSARQFFDARDKRVEGVRCSPDFDYWVYVVERQKDGGLCVLPIKNPAQRTAKFEFRGGTWRDLTGDYAEASLNGLEGSKPSGGSQYG